MSYLLHLNYFVRPQWNIFTKFMIENCGVYASHTAAGDAASFIQKGKYRDSYGLVAGLEYYPLKHDNLHFFAAYIARKYDYTALAKDFGAQDYSTSRFSVGFIWKMQVF